MNGIRKKCFIIICMCFMIIFVFVKFWKISLVKLNVILLGFDFILLNYWIVKIVLLYLDICWVKYKFYKYFLIVKI